MNNMNNVKFNLNNSFTYTQKERVRALLLLGKKEVFDYASQYKARENAFKTHGNGEEGNL
jgi:hypothetical protein